MDILTIIGALSVGSLLCAWFYTKKSFRRNVFGNKISLIQIITSIIPTILFVLFFTASYILITLNSQPSRLLLDNFILIILVLFVSFATLGVGIHFAGKCLSDDLKNNPNKKLKTELYIFHIFLGHHITYILGMLSLLAMAIFNIYRPFILQISLEKIIVIIFFGFLWALSWTFTIVFPPINRITYILLGWVSTITIFILFITNNSNIYRLPYSIFFFSTVFFITLLITIIYFIENIKKKHIGLLLNIDKKILE